MNFHRLSSLSIVFLAFAPLLAVSPCHAGRMIDATVIAEQSRQGATRPPTAPGVAVACLLHDGGYIEAGDPVAGESPPAGDLVRGPLRAALSAAGYQPGGTAPSLLIVTHWGVLRRDSLAVRRPFDIDPNLRARLALVTSSRVVDRARDYFRAARTGYVEPALRDAFELARDARYFVAITAYDYPDARQGRATLLWRVCLSAQANSGGMNDIIPALAAGAGTYLGRDLRTPEHPSMPRTLAPASAPAFVVPPDLPADFLPHLARQEHDDFSGLTDPADRSAQAPP